MRLRFAKMSGAGNDFVLIEGRPRGAAPGELAARLCDRRGGVGADGLLLLERGASPRLEYHNADGSAAFCGNGSRCAAWWAYRAGWTGGRREFLLRTSAGPLRARVTGSGRTAIAMPEPQRIRLGLRLKAAGRSLLAHSLDTGVPHAVVEARDLEGLDVEGLGRALRRHAAFKPAGTNVDFVRFGPKGVAVRTYERGVEAETLACGTGAVAAAAAGFLLGRCRPPVPVRVRGGETLRVSFSAGAGGSAIRDVWLEGPARVVFTGEVEL